MNQKIVREHIKPFPLPSDGETLVEYAFWCSVHMKEPTQHCSICCAANLVREQHQLALNQNKQYLNKKNEFLILQKSLKKKIMEYL